VIKQDGNSTWREKNCDAVSRRECSGMVNFKSPAPMQFNSKHLKWFQLPQSSQNGVKVLDSHISTSRYSS
jgi:hypothetical protein